MRSAALTAYPQFSCTGGPFKVRTQWGVEKDVYCAGNDATFQFIYDILDEVIGALSLDNTSTSAATSALKTAGRQCPKCQARIKAEGLKDEHELQSYFIRKIEEHLASKGRRLIGWDEILEGGLPPRGDRDELARHERRGRRGEVGPRLRRHARHRTAILIARTRLSVSKRLFLRAGSRPR